MRAVLIATMTAILASTLVVSGCGQKGPLYIPQPAIAEDSDSSTLKQDKSTPPDATLTPTAISD